MPILLGGCFIWSLVLVLAVLIYLPKKPKYRPTADLNAVFAYEEKRSHLETKSQRVELELATSFISNPTRSGIINRLSLKNRNRLPTLFREKLKSVKEDEPISLFDKRAFKLLKNLNSLSLIIIAGL